MPAAAWTTPDTAVTDFARRGLLLLHPDALGVPADVHERIYVREKALHDARQPVTPASVPDVTQVINAPGLVDMRPPRRSRLGHRPLHAQRLLHLGRA